MKKPRKINGYEVNDKYIKYERVTLKISAKMSACIRMGINPNTDDEIKEEIYEIVVSDSGYDKDSIKQELEEYFEKLYSYTDEAIAKSYNEALEAYQKENKKDDNEDIDVGSCDLCQSDIKNKEDEFDIYKHLGFETNKQNEIILTEEKNFKQGVQIRKLKEKKYESVSLSEIEQKLYSKTNIMTLLDKLNKEPSLLHKPFQKKDLLSDKELCKINLYITKDIEEEYIFLKYPDVQKMFISGLVKDISFKGRLCKLQILDTIKYKLRVAEYHYFMKMINESEGLRGEALFKYYKDNTLDYRNYLIKNRLLNKNNNIAIISCIFKFLPHITIKKEVEKFFLKYFGEKVTNDIKKFRAARKQKQYYTSMSTTKDIDTKLKQIALNYTDRIISMKKDDKLSLAKIRVILSQEAREGGLIPKIVKRPDRTKGAGERYDTVVSETMLSVKVIKSILVNNGIKI